MNSAEIKLELFRKIDQLDNNELERIYMLLLKLLEAGPSDATTLSQELKSALDEALIASKKGQGSTPVEVIQKNKG